MTSTVLLAVRGRIAFALRESAVLLARTLIDGGILILRAAGQRY
jgi:hypothetical protein